MFVKMGLGRSELETLVLLAEEADAHDVRGQHVRGELDAVEPQAKERAKECARGGLAEPETSRSTGDPE